MSNLPAINSKQEVSRDELAFYKENAPTFVKSGAFADLKNEDLAVVKCMFGRELGMSITASLNGIHLINGKPFIGANGIASAIKSSAKYNYKVLEKSNSVCAIEFLEKEDGVWVSLGVETYTIEMARQFGVKNLDKMPQNMLFARCISNGYRTHCPDVFSIVVYDSEYERPEESSSLETAVKQTKTVDAKPIERPTKAAKQPDNLANVEEAKVVTDAQIEAEQASQDHVDPNTGEITEAQATQADDKAEISQHNMTLANLIEVYGCDKLTDLDLQGLVDLASDLLLHQSISQTKAEKTMKVIYDLQAAGKASEIIKKIELIDSTLKPQDDVQF